MKLKSFNAENAASSKYNRLPSVNVGYKSGVLYFNIAAKEAAKLQPGDKIEFLQDEENPKDWYFSKSDNGLLVRAKNAKGAEIQSSKLAKEILHSIDVYKPATMRIGEPLMLDGKLLFPIITKSAK